MDPCAAEPDKFDRSSSNLGRTTRCEYSFGPDTQTQFSPHNGQAIRMFGETAKARAGGQLRVPSWETQLVAALCFASVRRAKFTKSHPKKATGSVRFR